MPVITIYNSKSYLIFITLVFEVSHASEGNVILWFYCWKAQNTFFQFIFFK